MDLVTKAFDVTQKYRMPVFVFADSLVGGLMEAVTLPEAKEPPRTPEWAVVGKGIPWRPAQYCAECLLCGGTADEKGTGVG